MLNNGVPIENVFYGSSILYIFPKHPEIPETFLVHVMDKSAAQFIEILTDAANYLV